MFLLGECQIWAVGIWTSRAREREQPGPRDRRQRGASERNLRERPARRRHEREDAADDEPGKQAEEMRDEIAPRARSEEREQRETPCDRQPRAPMSASSADSTLRSSRTMATS